MSFIYIDGCYLFFSSIMFRERDPQEKLKAIWTVCNSLPEANKNNLRYLIKFLYELTKHSDVNKMSSHNLAIAIGPSLFWSSGESME